MKQTNNISDDQLRSLLKKASMEAPENPWFTRKVLNRLPEKRRTHNWILWCVYVVVAVACSVGWGVFCLETDIAALLRNLVAHPHLTAPLLHAIALLAVTAVVVWQIVATQLHSDHP